jgi:hypothetical protein
MDPAEAQATEGSTAQIEAGVHRQTRSDRWLRTSLVRRPRSRVYGIGIVVDRDGNATSQAQLRAYWLIMQYAAELAKRGPAEQERFYTLLRQA